MSAAQVPDPGTSAELRRLHRRNAQFSRSLQVALATYLRTEITVTPEPVRRELRQEVAEADPGDDFFATAAGGAGSLVIRLSSEAVFPILEVLLGGAADQVTAPEREITDIEQQLLVDFLAVVAQQFERAWPMELTTALRGLTDERERVKALPQEEQLLILPSTLKMGEFQASMSLMVAAPTSDLGTAAPATIPEIEESQVRLLERLKPLELTFEVQAEGSTVALRDLFQLRAGQVLVLDHPVDRPLTCRVNDIPRLTGRVVRSGEWRAFRIQAPAEE
jgi:flagellar motor switch protein FliM